MSKCVMITKKDLDGLPIDVIEKLSLSLEDKIKMSLLDIFEEQNCQIDINHLIIDLYRKSEIVIERAKINNILYRMTKEGLISSIKGKKGVFELQRSYQCSSIAE